MLGAAPKSSTREQVRTITEDMLKTGLEKAKLEGPNINARSKIEQLEMMIRFDSAFAERKLDPVCSMAHHLWQTRDLRRSLLHGLVGELQPNEQQFRIPARLMKYPASVAAMGDRGYYKVSINFPNMNRVLHPSFLQGRSQFEYEDVFKDLDIKRERWVQEQVISHILKCKILSNTIKYEDFRLISPMVSFAMGVANFSKPSREPGNWSTYLHAIRYRMRIFEKGDKLDNGTLAAKKCVVYDPLPSFLYSI